MSDISTGYTFVDGEKGITAQKLNDEVNLAVINPAFVSAKPSTSVVDNADQLLILKAAGTYARAPFSTVSTSVAGQLALADNTTNGMLRQVSGLTTDFVDGTNHCRDISTSVRARYNAIGNSNFETNNRMAGGTTTGAAMNLWSQDRWNFNKNGGTKQYGVGVGNAPTGGWHVPGSNFRISNNTNFITLSTAQASLAAGDVDFLLQTIEGPNLRELIDDVHSISILCMTNVTGGLKFALSLRDTAATPAYSLVKLCTIPAPNVQTLITLPNIPVFPTAGTFGLIPGSAGYQLSICVSCGTTFTAPANDTWQTGNYVGAVGMDQLCTKPTGSYLYLGFIQHESGPVCGQLIDKPFSGANGNYEECLRYYQKSYDYDVAVNTNSALGECQCFVLASTGLIVPTPFKRSMAKVPTVTSYCHNQVGANLVWDGQAAGARSISGTVNVGKSGFSGFQLATLNAANSYYNFHYTADTGW